MAEKMNAKNMSMAENNKVKRSSLERQTENNLWLEEMKDCVVDNICGFECEWVGVQA